MTATERLWYCIVEIYITAEYLRNCNLSEDLDQYLCMYCENQSGNSYCTRSNISWEVRVYWDSMRRLVKNIIASRMWAKSLKVQLADKITNALPRSLGVVWLLHIIGKQFTSTSDTRDSFLYANESHGRNFYCLAFSHVNLNSQWLQRFPIFLNFLQNLWWIKTWHLNPKLFLALQIGWTVQIKI